MLHRIAGGTAAAHRVDLRQPGRPRGREDTTSPSFRSHRMQLPLQITFRGLPHSDALETAIRERAVKLDRFHPRITSCRVVVELAGRHQQQGKQFVVRLDIGVPGAEIAVNRDHAEDAMVAVRDAFDAARRKLEDHAREQRGDVKHHEK